MPIVTAEQSFLILGFPLGASLPLSLALASFKLTRRHAGLLHISEQVQLASAQFYWLKTKDQSLRSCTLAHASEAEVRQYGRPLKLQAALGEASACCTHLLSWA